MSACIILSGFIIPGPVCGTILKRLITQSNERACELIRAKTRGTLHAASRPVSAMTVLRDAPRKRGTSCHIQGTHSDDLRATFNDRMQ